VEDAQNIDISNDVEVVVKLEKEGGSGADVKEGGETLFVTIIISPL